MARVVTISVCLLLSCTLLLNSRGVWGKKGKCEVCKNFVKAFEEVMKSTETASFAGGDTSWEEEKLGAYANSEVRLVEILDGVCKDYECHRLLEENEEHVERWWFKLRHKKDSLKMWFCHDQLDVCCPENTFGPTCKACPGGVDSPCGGQGKCEGAEEKDGSGSCLCNRGYRGDSCNKCDKKFYNDTFGCIACDKSCKNECSGGGAGDCEECASGYVRSEEDAECKDVDECKEKQEEDEEEEDEEEDGSGVCEEGKYCFNIPGSFRCNDCDRSCEKACMGAGPARCVACAAGYYKNRFNVCKDIDECEGGEGWEGEGVECEGDTFCENTPGSYRCKACHVACVGGCKGAGPGNCFECKSGFNLEDDECRDVNECEGETSLCDVDSENCSNLIGSFSCKCKTGLIRVEGKCVDKVVKTNESKKKTKKRKKPQKGGKSAGERRTDTSMAEQQEREAERTREREAEREREREVAETEGEKERKRRLGVQEGGTEGQVGEGMGSVGGVSSEGVDAGETVEESHDQLEKSHDQSEGSHDQSEKSHDQSEGSHDQSEKLHDQLEKSQDQSEWSHDQSQRSHDQESHQPPDTRDEL